jgi:hypothetical protein
LEEALRRFAVLDIDIGEDDRGAFPGKGQGGCPANA